jgi:toxin-antitoxin system PIN domain toxin
VCGTSLSRLTVPDTPEVILIDANLLLYAWDDHAPHHAASRAWLEETLWGREPAAFSWTVILSFLRLATDPRVFQRPLSISQGAEVISDWFAASRFILLQPGERHWEILKGLLVAGQASRKLVMDAHLAALAIEHGATLASVDRDFARFPGLRLLNPLA